MWVKKANNRSKLTFNAGEKPGVGTYKCSDCGEKVVLIDLLDSLPRCPKCDGRYYKS